MVDSIRVQLQKYMQSARQSFDIQPKTAQILSCLVVKWSNENWIIKLPCRLRVILQRLKLNDEGILHGKYALGHQAHFNNNNVSSNG